MQKHLIEYSVSVPTGLHLALAEESATHAANLKVETVAESLGAQHLRSTINYKLKDLEEKRKAITAPILESKKRIDAMFAVPRDVLLRALTVLDTRLVAFNAHLEAAG